MFIVTRQYDWRIVKYADLVAFPVVVPNRLMFLAHAISHNGVKHIISSFLRDFYNIFCSPLPRGS